MQESEQMSLPVEADDVAALQEAREEALLEAQQARMARRSRTLKQVRRERVQEAPCRWVMG